MDEMGIFISRKGFERKIEIFIPFSDIINIRWVEGLKGNAKNYILEFENPTRFGSEVTFNAVTKSFEFPENFIINELGDKIRAAKLSAKLTMQKP